MKLLSIVLSFRNEEKNIPLIVHSIVANMKKVENWNYEIIFVNDASDDNSEVEILKLQKFFNIKLINMSRNFGISACVIAGFRYSKGDALIYMDTDMQDPPEIIPDLIKKYESGFEVVHTRRVERLGEPIAKLRLTKFAYKIINYLSDIKLPIESGDFKLISKKAVEHILKMNEKDPYIRGLSVWVGFNQSFYDYVRQPRAIGKSKFNFFSKNPYLEFLRAITSFSSKPLYFGVFIGIITILISLILIFYSFIIKLFNMSVTGIPSVLIAISFFSGIILIKLGIISLYLKRIFDQTKNRPEYIIKDIKENKDND